MNKKSQVKFRKTLVCLIILIGILSLYFVIAQITIPITSPNNPVTDLKLERLGDKLNITWQDKFVTIKGFFYYLGNNQTYTFQEASVLGNVTYDYWVNKTDDGMKFGGVINLSNSPPSIKNKGFYIVFELINKSENINLKLDGGKLWLDENVAIEWKDRINEENDFELYNNTIAYMRYKSFNSTDNKTYYSAYHNTVEYDPTITISNSEVYSGSLVNVTAEVNFTHLNISTTAPYDSLLAYWNFDGDKENTLLTKHYDWTNYGNDGTGVADAVANNTNCIYGDCANFDGNGDSISTPFNGTEYTELTISFWAYSKKYGGTLAFIDNSPSTAGFSFRHVTRQLDFFVYNKSGTTGLVSKALGLTDNTWQHIVGVHNKTNNVLYINGVQVAIVSYDASTGISPSSNLMAIGSHAPASSATTPFNGSTDEVMLFNTSLTAAQILAIYNNQSSRFAVSGTQSLIVAGCNGDLSGYDCTNIQEETACGEQPNCLWLLGSCTDFSGAPYCKYFLSNATCEGEVMNEVCSWRFGVDTAENRVNITTYIENNSGSSINLSVGYKNLTGWFYTNPQIINSGMVQTFNISSTSNGLSTLSLNYTHLAGNSTNPFYSPIIKNNVTLTTWSVSEGVTDNEYPQFSNEWDDNGTLLDTGTGEFNITVVITNGTVILHINNTDIEATNLTTDVYNASFDFTEGGIYLYNWTSYGNGTNHNLNTSINRYYTVNTSVVQVNYTRNITQTFTSTSLMSRTGGLIRNNLQNFINSFLTLRLGNLQRSISQNLIKLFSINRLTSLQRSVLQPFTTNIIISRISSFFKSTSQNFVMSLSVSKSISFPKSITQSFTSLFSISSLRSIPTNINQFFTTNFITTRLYSGTRGIFQSFTSLFSVSKFTTFPKSIFQSFISLFSIDVTYSGTRGISQFFTDNFIIDTMYNGVRSISQHFLGLFSIIKTRLVPNSVSQSFSSTFSISRTYTGVRNTILTPSLNFVTSRLTSLQRSLSQSFTFLFSVTTIETTFGGIIRSISQSFTGLFSTDTIYAGTRGITQSFMGLFNIDAIYSGFRSISQIFNFNQIMSSSYTRGRNVFQSFSSSFIITRTGSFFRNIFQGINMFFDYLREVAGVLAPIGGGSVSQAKILRLGERIYKERPYFGVFFLFIFAFVVIFLLWRYGAKDKLTTWKRKSKEKREKRKEEEEGF